MTVVWIPAACPDYLFRSKLDWRWCKYIEIVLFQNTRMIANSQSCNIILRSAYRSPFLKHSKISTCIFIPLHHLRYKWFIMVSKWTISTTMEWQEWQNNDDHINTLSPKQNGHHFADDIFKCNFWMKMFKFRLKFQWDLFPWVELTKFRHRFR